MAAYPDLPTSYGSDPEVIVKPQIDRSEDGTARVRNYMNDKIKIQLKHPYLSSTDRTTLETFYTTNRLLTFTHTSKSDGVTYTCVFSTPPSYDKHPDGSSTATLVIEQV